MSDEQTYVPFSQRDGLSPLPAQLRLGEVSDELRRLVDYYIGIEVEGATRKAIGGDNYFDKRWERVARDLHVVFFKNRAREYENNPAHFRLLVEATSSHADIGELFDFI